MIPRNFEILTERLRLRIPDASDLPFVFSATRYKGFADGMVWNPPDTLEELSNGWEEHNLPPWDEGRAYGFTIEDRESGERLGRIVIRQTKMDHVWDLGFWTHPEKQGRGFMTEACKAVVKFGFDQLGAVAIEAQHAIWNKASEIVLERSGFKFVQYNEKGLFKHGKWIEENLVRVRKEDWESL